MRNILFEGKTGSMLKAIRKKRRKIIGICINLMWQQNYERRKVFILIVEKTALTKCDK